MIDLSLKHVVAEPIQRNKVEFWAVTTLFVFALLSLTIGESSNRYEFWEAGIPFRYYRNYFFPQLFRYLLLYGGFLLLNFKLIPRLISKKRIWLTVFLLILSFVATGLFLGVFDTYSKNYLLADFATEQQGYDYIFQNSFRHALWLLLMVGFYSLIKYTALYLYTHSGSLQSKHSMLTQDSLLAFVLWMLSIFLLMIMGAPAELVLGWGVFTLSALLLHSYSYHFLIPRALQARKPFRFYLLRVLLILLASFLPIAFVLILLLPYEDSAIGITTFNAFFQFFITAPISWVYFKRRLKGREEVWVLQQELGQSHASLDFLRSQINPHFLFNALNTLYGTALQENSERTAQGIQILGDMMRFMLHENHQQKILLSREIEYLRNYIDLQLLRTSSSPNIHIETNIHEVLEERYIAPMLLIPFVENAFKHGISLKHKSWIKISLYCEGKKLFFDVYNSTHEKAEQDPEKANSGIGLQNVKQRLEMLYPQRHELIIRETAQEYFVHLTLEL